MSTIEEMLKQMGETVSVQKEECKEDGETIYLRKFTNEAKGYHTVIPDAVFDKVIALMKAHDELRKVMYESCEEQIEQMFNLPSDEKDYAVLELMMFNDKVNEAWDKISDLVVVHEVLTKDYIDRFTTEEGISLKTLVHTK